MRAAQGEAEASREGTSSGLDDEAHQIMSSMKQLMIDRTKADGGLGALIDRKHVIALGPSQGADVEVGGEGGDVRGARHVIMPAEQVDGPASSLAATVNKLAAMSQEGLNAQRSSSKSRLEFVELERKMRQKEDECKRLKVRLEEYDADRHDIDEMSLNVQMLKDQLKKKEHTLREALAMHKEALKEKEHLELNLAHAAHEETLKATVGGTANGGTVNVTNGAKGPIGSPGTDQNRNTDNMPAKGRGKGRSPAVKMGFRSMSVSSIDLSESTQKAASPGMDDLPAATTDAVSRALELPTLKIRALETELSRVQGLLNDHIAEQARMTQR